MTMLHPSRAALLTLALLPALVRADDGADLRTVLDRMTAAVLEGDKAGYVACVDPADAIFFTEQKNWAADFDRHKTAEFKLEWAQPEKDSDKPGAPTITGDEARGSLSMTWKIAEENRAGRSLTVPVRFVKRDGAWLFAGEQWKVIEAPGVRVCFAEGLDEVAGRVASVLPAVREHVHEGFGLTISRVQVVKLYNSMKHLQESIYLSYDDGLAGWNEPEESVKILSGRRSSERELKILLAHEYGHVCTFELGPKANSMPWWILEGVAELSAEDYAGTRFHRTVERWAASDRLADWARLADFHTCKDEDQVFVYQQGHHMVGYISDTFGRERRNAWMKAMSQGASLDDATQQTLGLTFNALDLQWRRALRDQAEKSKQAQEDAKNKAGKGADEKPATPGT